MLKKQIKIGGVKLKMFLITTSSAGFLSNRNIIMKSLSLKLRIDIRIKRAAVGCKIYKALKDFVIIKESEKNASVGWSARYCSTNFRRVSDERM